MFLIELIFIIQMKAVPSLSFSSPTVEELRLDLIERVVPQ